MDLVLNKSMTETIFLSNKIEHIQAKLRLVKEEEALNRYFTLLNPLGLFSFGSSVLLYVSMCICIVCVRSACHMRLSLGSRPCKIPPLMYISYIHMSFVYIYSVHLYAMSSVLLYM